MGAKRQHGVLEKKADRNSAFLAQSDVNARLNVADSLAKTTGDAGRPA
jgi:hypothetical protein